MSSMNQSTVQSRTVITTTDRLINTSTKKLAGKKKIDEDVRCLSITPTPPPDIWTDTEKKIGSNPSPPKKIGELFAPDPVFFILPRSVDPLGQLSIGWMFSKQQLILYQSCLSSKQAHSQIIIRFGDLKRNLDKAKVT